MVDFNIFTFEQAARETFEFQYANNELYRSYVNCISVAKPSIQAPDQIPFLPIQFFKTHEVKTTIFIEQQIFESSGTTKTGNSKHYIKDLSIYKESFLRSFELFYGKPSRYCILALLPSYLERSGSSLVMMADEIIKESGHPLSGFYLDQHEKLHQTLTTLGASGQQVILLGVTFALLDFAERFPMKLNNTIVMETGGMKGRREELIRSEVHQKLCSAWGLSHIHAEYGMTELLSQAYSKADGIFYCPPWMRVLLRSEDDPLSFSDKSGRPNTRGIINIIDLANRYSCAFIATDDLGILHDDGGFEVIGRMDNSDIRGCSLMVV